MDSDLEISFRQSFKRAFIRQKDDYSCGPACLATIANLEGVGDKYDYDFFRALLDPRPNIGSHPLAMIGTAREYLPFTGVGEGLYKGGLALGYIVYEENVKSFPSEEEIDHYVVFLARKNNNIVYYDPYDDKIYSRDLRGMKWHSTFTWPGIDHTIQRWAATFATPPGLSFNFCVAAAVPHVREVVRQPKRKSYSFTPV